jgi:hypothetical protein
MTITANTPSTAPAPSPLHLADSFGADLHVGDVVTALFRGPEMVPALVPARVVGCSVSGVLLDPLAAGPRLLDGTEVTPGQHLSCPPAELVLDDRTARGADLETEWAMIGHFDATEECLAIGDTVAFAIGGTFGSLHWGRGQIVSCTETLLSVVAGADYKTALFDPFVTAGEQVRIWSPRTVRVGSPA